MGVARPDLEEARAVFQEDLAGPFSAKALGIAGDQTGHLLWRLGDGELPLRRRPSSCERWLLPPPWRPPRRRRS